MTLTPPAPRGFSLRLPRPVWMGLATAVLSAMAAIAGDPVDEIEISDEPRVPAGDVAVYRWLFGAGSDAGAAIEQLDTLLRQDLAIVDLVCGLTSAQKEKLRLAGRGDNKRLLDHVEDVGMKLRLFKNDRTNLNEVARKAPLLKPGIANDASLFVKSLKTVLTAEQRARFDPLREIIRRGAMIRTRENGSGEILVIDLNDISPGDDGVVHLKGLTEVRQLELCGSSVTDPALAQLEGLPKLSWLNLAGTEVTDAGLAHLGGLVKLEWLGLSNSQVADAGLENLKGLTSLKYLGLDNTLVADEGLSHLNGLSSLQFLRLDNTQVTDAGLAHLHAMTGLQQLWLDNTQVTDAGLVSLTGLSNLQLLDLANTQVTDAGAAQLKTLKSLQVLHLPNTQISDSGLELLKELPQLQVIWLARTQVTDAGIGQLQRQLPALRIRK